MSKITRVNFRSKLHLICSKNRMRVALCHVWFKNGFAYASNGHIAIKQSLKLHDLLEEGIENLEGKAIHADTFRELLKYDIVEPKKDYIEAAKKNIITKFQYSIVDKKFPNIEDAMPKGSPKKIKVIGIDFNLIEKLNRALIRDSGNSYRLEFYGDDEAIIIRNNQPFSKEEQFAILMPIILSE